MILRLWLKLLLWLLLIILGLVSVMIAFLVEWMKILDWTFLVQTVPLTQFPLWVILLSFVLAVAVLISFVFARGLATPYEDIHSRINWLILGQYEHQTFSKYTKKPNWYEPFIVVDHDLNLLRTKMAQLSTDLQELSAAPLFVGEETKEEIIEAERTRIARELHDSVSQQLFAAMMILSAINESMQDELSEKVQPQLLKVGQIISNAQTEMRALLLHLRPIELADRNLKEGIVMLLEELKPKIPQKVEWNLQDISLESGIEDHLFRIVQEAISNTLRHAKASRFEVYLGQEGQMVRLKIMDDGKGFDVANIGNYASYGLTNMQERISSLGGNIKFMSLPNQGTVIDIFIPIKRK